MDLLGVNHVQKLCDYANEMIQTRWLQRTSPTAHRHAGAQERTAASSSAAGGSPTPLPNSPLTRSSVPHNPCRAVGEAEQVLQEHPWWVGLAPACSDAGVEAHAAGFRADNELTQAQKQPNLGILTALPRDALECIFNYADSKSKVVLYRTSKSMQAAMLERTLHFNGKEPGTSLTLDTAGDPTVASSALQTAAHAAHSVTLHVLLRVSPLCLSFPTSPFSNKHAWLDTVLQPWLTTTAASTPPTTTTTAAAAVAAAVQPSPFMQQVSAIILTNIYLDHPFPTSLGKALPHLQHYTLDEVQWPSTAAVGAVKWPHLNTLKITNCNSWQLPHGLSPIQFPSLTELRLHRGELGHPLPSTQEDVMTMCAAFSQQLTHLEMTGQWRQDRPDQTDKVFRTNHFPMLTKVHVSWALGDSQFSALVEGAPALKDLQVESLVLHEWHDSEQCSLEKLSIGRWAAGSDWVATLARLPRTPVRMSVDMPSIIHVPSTVDSQQAAAVLSGLNFIAQAEVRLAFPVQSDAADCAARVQALVPMLKALCLERASLSQAYVSEQFFKVLGVLGLDRIEFVDCSWAPGSSTSFWPFCPQVKHVWFSTIREDSIASQCNQIIIFCCTATQPVTVCTSKTCAHLQQRIRQAVQAAGKQDLVTLCMSPPTHSEL